MKEIGQKIEAHLQAPFPDGWRGKKYQEKDLTVLDSNVAGLIMAAVHGGGQMSTRRRQELSDEVALLKALVPTISEAEPKSYFGRLLAIAEETLGRVPVRR